ncbi:hypothetical protein BBF96_01145 [Anoxybacter fermentans]|uniref:Transporter n=1 Tax=Anoxybacter fermentans TaxID=1323375 RepID=A0A3Q9HNK3_9FIRM|nr:AEC family transporter [Anoxybacter fermentans]AZR72119.1 hypothetical protein BBF96_01145 [Anoxybacter fermentans]
MELLTLFYQILVLFMILLIGFIIYRLKVIDEHLIGGLSRLIMDVTLPAMIITSMSFDFSREILFKSGQLFFISLGLYFFSWIIALLVTWKMKITDRERDIFQFMLTFSNVGFMGYPVIGAIYGKLGIFYTSIFNFTFGLVVWTLGVWLFRRREGENFTFHWRMFLTPGIVAVLIGFGFFLFSIKLPYPIFHTLDLLGSTTTPLSMLMVGALMGKSAIRKMWKNKQIYLASFVRLVVIPFFTLILVLPFKFSETMLGVIVILMGMPAAANTAIFAKRFGGDAELGAEVVFISTLFSIVTIPCFLFLLKAL